MRKAPLRRRLGLAVTLATGWALLGAAVDREPVTDAPAPAQPQADSAVTEDEWEDPIYRPPDIRRPGSRTGGGVRGPQRRTLMLLAPPDHAGKCNEAQPTLYWYLGETVTTPVELVIQEENSVQPLALRTLPSPMEAGYHGVSLREIGVSLRQGIVYEWSIALVTDAKRRSRDAAVGQALIFYEPSRALALRATKLRRGQLAGLFAEAGYWYDAVEAASRGVETYPALAGPRRQRTSLGRQVALNLP